MWKAKCLYKYCINNYQPFQLMFNFSLDLFLSRTFVQEDFEVFTCCWNLKLYSSAFTVSVRYIDIALCGGFNTLTKSTVSEIIEFHVIRKLLQKLVCRNYCAFRKLLMYLFLVFGEGRILYSGHTAEAGSVLCFGEGLSY